MSFSFLNLNVRCSSTTRACISQERNHGTPRNDKQGKPGILNNIISVDNTTVIPDSRDSEHHKHPPLVSALKALVRQNVASFCFPGHNNGRAAPSSLSDVIGLEPFLHDLPALPELGKLFASEGPIRDAQRKAAELFGAKETWFLVGGTTCGIQASIMATCSPGDTLILPRNSHVSTFSSLVLSGAIPKYITPKYDFDWDIACGVTPSQVEKAIKELHTTGRKASAVFITSPTYNGMCSNLEQISLLCHSHNLPLIVDEAHGAHLGFHQNLPQSALSQGADISIQSTHKVLCSFSQSSMLHISSGNLVDRERISQCLQSLQTTSPSHLLLASLDAARAQISQHPKTIFNKAIKIAMEAKALIKTIPGITVLNSSTFQMDPLRITVGVWNLAISGFEANHLIYNDYQVASELVGTRSLMFSINLGTNRDDVIRLVNGLQYVSQIHSSSIQVNDDISIQSFMGTTSSMILSPRDAFFASKTKVSFKDSIGKVCGELVCPFPPGIPLLIPGELITDEALSYLVEVKKNGGFISGAADPSLSSIIVCG